MTAALFQSRYVPFAEEIGLVRALAAFSLTNERRLNDYWRQVEAFDAVCVNPDGARQWWRVVREGHEAWISLDPGETRHEPPEPPCVVVDLLEAEHPSWSCRKLLAHIVEHYRSIPNPYESEIRRLAIVEERLRDTSEEGPRLPAAVLAEIRGAVETDRHAVGRVLSFVYDEYLLSGRCNIDYLTEIIAIAQLQSAAGVHIAEDWLGEPLGAAYAFVELILNDNDRRDRMIGDTAQFCADTFTMARKDVASALDETEMFAMTRKLLLALHRFELVFLIDKTFRAAGVTLDGSGLSPILIEESYVCTLTGLCSGAQFVIEPPQDVALGLRRQVGSVDPTLAQLKRAARLRAREFEPAFTRRFADILAAEALSQFSSAEVATPGIEELLRLKATSPPGAFERGWINMALRSAFMRFDRQDDLAKIALEIAASAMLRHVEAPDA